MTTADLGALLRRLESFGVRLGLDTMRGLLRTLGDPQAKLATVLVAGTNGKGSTAAFLAAMATAAGYRTGLYTSPHLESVEERIRINGRAIASERLRRWLTRVVAAAETSQGHPPTYFEALTAVAFCVFAREAVELAVLEVGLGGRLDATNVADPELALITEIGLEHQDYLGESLASIAREKAGILRSARPAIAWVDRPEARRAIAALAGQVGAELAWGSELATIERVRREGFRRQTVWLRTPRARHELHLRLAGGHQAANLALAVLGCEELARRGFDRLDATAIAAGAFATRWPGRLEWIELPPGRGAILLDAAHNADGMRALADSLQRHGDRYVLLFGALADKQVGRELPPLATPASAVILTRPPSDRAVPPERLAALLPQVRTVVEPDCGAALGAALAASPGLLVACGSIYLVGAIRAEVRARFGVPRAAVEISSCSRGSPTQESG